MTQFRLQIMKRTSKTTSQHSEEAVTQHKLGINWGKTNTMVISKKAVECNIEIEEHSVKSVKEVVYLGVKISADGRMEEKLEEWVLQ